MELRAQTSKKPLRRVMSALVAPLSIVASLAFSATCTACAPLVSPGSGTVRVELKFPLEMPLPPEMPAGEGLRWTVSWIDGNGVRRRQSGIRDRCAIDLERSVATAVTARPDVTALGAPELAAAPVGAVFPSDARATPASVSLDLDAIGAVEARAFETILSMARPDDTNARLLATRINWRKFRERVSSLESPGLTDCGRFARAAHSGRILASNVSALPTREIAVRPTRGVIAPGTTLVPEWPGGTVARWAGGSESRMVLPEGLTRFLADDGWLTVSVSDGEAICAFYDRYSLRE